MISNIKYQNEVQMNIPKFNFHKVKKVAPITFSNPNLLIIDKGRNINEKSAVLIENDVLLGYCFVDLEYQINNIEILKSLISPLDDNLENRAIVKNHLQKKRVERIIRF